MGTNRAINLHGRWKKLSEVPDLPFKDFDELKHNIAIGTCKIGIDYSAATLFGSIVKSPIGHIGEFILLVMSWVPAVASIAVAILLHSWIYLGGVVATVITVYFANPTYKERHEATLLGVLSIVAVVVALVTNRYPLAWISACVSIPFICVRLFYRLKTMAVRVAAYESETFFLYLYEHYCLTIMDTRNGNIYANHPEFHR